MKKPVVVILAAIAALMFWKRRREPEPPTNAERLRARVNELAAAERERARNIWRSARERAHREQ